MTADRKHLTNAEAAAYLGISDEYLHQLRHRGQGPRYYQPTGPRGKVYYFADDLDSWLRSTPKQETEPEPAAV